MKVSIPLAVVACTLLPWVGGATEPSAEPLAEMRRQSPHLPLGATDVSEAGCPACHTTTPAAGAAVADAALREPPARTCRTCHPGSVHSGAAEHLGRKQANPMTSPLPLGPDGTIGCWSCHDVHQPPAPRPAPSRLAALLAVSPPTGPQALLALPVTELCSACHGVVP